MRSQTQSSAAFNVKENANVKSFNTKKTEFTGKISTG
jgi:hypothetical protein